MRFPIIKVKDIAQKTEHIVGTNIHDTLEIQDDGTISYYNLQNGEGTRVFGDYRFVGNVDEMGMTVEFVSFEEIKNIYQQMEQKDEEKEKFIESLFEMIWDEKSNKENKS
ncbi:hypothetical protein [Bacillus piscicola]|uniref:hypothetical protein n=1 Tax=Bacillus piscicola TaxID=1632684 RepID=UPI001F08A8A1|nr:hypothetical protein [Bacillus piscicola]